MAISDNANSGKLEQDGVAAKLVPDPAKPAGELTTFAGYLGKSGEEGRWRLYLKPELNEYVTFSAGDLRHSEKSEGRTTIWLDASAQVDYARPDPMQAQAGFLRGPITAKHLKHLPHQISGKLSAGALLGTFWGFCDTWFWQNTCVKHCTKGECTIHQDNMHFTEWKGSYCTINRPFCNTYDEPVCSFYNPNYCSKPV